MKYIFLLALFSCKPRIIDRHDFIIYTNKGEIFKCDYKDDNNVYTRCKNTSGNTFDSIIVHGGTIVLVIKEK